MSEVKRYKAVINDKPYKPYAYCEESSDGIYVRYDDYAALQQKLDAVLAEHPDARRMDWLVSKCVEVRQPLRYGSAAMFRSHAITDEEDEHYATKLREQIDNAILSEGATND